MRTVIVGSWALPWEELTEQQRTTRLDLVLGEAHEFAYDAQHDSYRRWDSDKRSPDFCPAADVEERRRWRDRHANRGRSA